MSDSENGTERNIHRYLEDLNQIKKLMQHNEERGLIEHWAFYGWALLVLAGTLISGWALRKHGLDMHQVYLFVWLPVILLGLFQETIAWIRKMDRESSPLFTRRFVKFMISLASLFIVFCIALYFLIEPDHPVPGLILLFVAAMLYFYGQLTYSSLYIEACLILLTGVLFVLLDVRTTGGFIFASVFTVIMLIAAGIHTKIMDNKHAG